MPRKKERPPAFQFYPKDLLSDINWQMMNYPERGMYWHLVSLCWIQDGLPSDVGSLARILQVNATVIEEAWKIIGKCFKIDDSNCTRLVHPRLEKERKKQREWVTKSREAGYKSAAKRWNYKSKDMVTNLTPLVQPNGNQYGNQKVTLQSASSSSIASSNIPPIVPQGTVCEIGKRCNGKFEECHQNFLRFWAEYPRHQPGKTIVMKSWCKTCSEAEQIISWVIKAKKLWIDPQYIPYASTFLNQKQWEGDLPVTHQSKDELFWQEQEKKYGADESGN